MLLLLYNGKISNLGYVLIVLYAFKNKSNLRYAFKNIVINLSNLRYAFV